MTRTEIMDILATAMTAFPNYKPNDVALAVDTWERALGPVPADIVREALNRLVKGKTFMPSLPEIVQAVQRGSQPDDAGALAQARRLWTYLDQMQFATSGYVPIRPGGIHPEVERVLRSVGIGEGWETRFRFAWRDRD